MPEIVTAGFLPLTDSGILIAAKECGFAEEEGIALDLIRETSWANIRDRIAVGHFQAAHMLAPMPIASNLGLTPLNLSLIAPMALGLGGNAITVGAELWNAMSGAGAHDVRDPMAAGQALCTVIAERQKAGLKPLQFGVVHPHSGHNFELRYWLAACGIHPECDVEIVIVPPPLMADALSSQRIDGFCVGEPWNSVAVAAGDGRIATVKAAIWKNSPEKVLGVRADWADANPASLSRLVRALYRAAQWCGTPGNERDLAGLLARPEYLGQRKFLIAKALEGAVDVSPKLTEHMADFFVPFDGHATFPWKSHALWFYTQMVRWGQVKHDPEHLSKVWSSYRPDLYRLALDPMSVDLPEADTKIEGQPQGGFFDQRVFDPQQVESYLAIQRESHR